MKVKYPIFGMEIEAEQTIMKREHERQTFYFYSQVCVNNFDADPHKFGHPQGHEQNQLGRR